MVWSLAGGAAFADPPKLKLDELRERARVHSKAVATARAGVGVREAQRGEALSLWAPTGEITYLFTGAPAIQCLGPGGNADPSVRTRECVTTIDPNNGQAVSAASTNIHGV